MEDLDSNTNLMADGRKRLRPSSLQQFVACRYQYYQAQILNNFQKPNAAAKAGNSVHVASEVGFSEKIKTGELPPLSVVIDAATDEWKKLNEAELIYAKGETFETYEKDIIKGTEDLYDDTMKRINPIAVEKSYKFDLGDHPVFSAIAGSVDIVEARGIRDIKFTKRKTNASKYVLQQSTYSLLRNRNGEINNTAMIDNVVRNKEVHELPLAIKEDYARYVINDILEVTKKFHETGDESIWTGTNPHVFFLCSPQWCGYWDICPHIAGLR